MSFYLKYELSRLLHADGSKTFQAVEKATRRNVLLHLVDKSASPALVEKIKRAETGRRTEIVEIGEFAGSFYVVTEPIEHFDGLGPWLDEHSTPGVAKPPPVAPSPQAAKPSVAAPSPPKQSTGTSDFDRFFGAAASPPTPPPPTDPKPVTSPTVVDIHPETAKPAPPPAAAQKAPGEFTRLFGEASKPEPRRSAPAPKPPPTPTPREQTRSSSGPGEMTKLFGEASPPRPLSAQPPSPPPAAPTGGGEFTRLFGDAPAPPVSNPPPAPPSPLQSSAAPPKTSGGTGGEFTRLFGDAPQKTPPPPAPPSGGFGEVQKSSGEFTRLFGGAPDTPAPPLAPPRPEPPRPAPAATSREVKPGSGQFTQLFGEAPQKTPAPQSPRTSGSGQFTQLFDDQGGSQESVPRLEPNTPRKAPEIEKSSGEFTRLFGPGGKGSASPKTPAPSTPKFAPSPLESPLATGSDAPGEFTRMFGNSSAAKPGGGYGAPPPPRPSSASFGEGLVGEISGDDALSPDHGPRVSKSSKPFQAPGEFTRMFGPSDPSQAPPQDFIPAAQKGDGYASGLFRNPHSEPKPPLVGSGGAAPSGQAGKPAAPGAYTLMFERKGGQSSGSTPAQAPPPAAATTPAAPATTKPSKWIIGGLIAAVLIAILSLGAAVYLFMNRDSGDPAENEQPAAEQPAESSPFQDRN